MKTSVIRSILVGILMLGIAMPSVASAGFCRYQGTWFGVMGEDNPALAGWMVTVEGRSFFHGTNNLESTTAAFDPRLPDELGNLSFPNAVALTTLRGNWMRTGNRTFIYTTTGFAVDAFGIPVYAAKLSGTVTLSRDCNSDVITSTLEVYLPQSMKNPFIDEADVVITSFPDVYAFRAYVDLP